jgi:transcriptional regulator with XRE-family HTH domain
MQCKFLFRDFQEELLPIKAFPKVSDFPLIRFGKLRNVSAMGYVDKLHKLCIMRGMDQVTLARRVGISKSSMSRILSGSQEPKLRLAYELAKVLGVTLDSLMNEDLPVAPSAKMVPLNEAQLTILNIVDRLGYEESIDRLLAVPGHGQGSPVSEDSAESGQDSHADDAVSGKTIIGIVTQSQGSGS